MFSISRNRHAVYIVASSFIFPPECRRIPFSVHSLEYLFSVDLFNDGDGDQCEVKLCCRYTKFTPDSFVCVFKEMLGCV